MHAFIGHWRAKPAWFELSLAARTAFLSKVSIAVQAGVGKSGEMLAWGSDELNMDNGERFFSVWRFPDRASAERYSQVLEQEGWNDYFESDTLIGTIQTPMGVFTRHITLKAPGQVTGA
jgi:hypothetical protein